MRSYSSRIAVAAAALLASAPLAAADVLVVNMDDPDAAFRTIQSAVDAALEGDTILVTAPADERSRYGAILIDGKGVTIRGQGRPHILTGAVTVQNLGPGRSVVLDDLHMNRTNAPGTDVYLGYFSGPSDVDPSGPGLHVAFSAGAVRVEDCSMEGSIGTRTWAGLQLTSALDVSLVNCSVVGVEGREWEDTGGTAAQMVASRLSAYGTDFVGGRGFEGIEWGTDGGDGLVMFQRSVTWLAACEVTGGAGGTSLCSSYPCYPFCGDGGTGLVVQAGSICFESRSQFMGGARGEIDLGLVGFAFGEPGDPGAASTGLYLSDPNTHVEVTARSRGLRSGTPAHLTIIGRPGEAARVAVGRAGGFRFFGASKGPLEVSDFLAPSGFVDVGTIPANGILEVDVPLPSAVSPLASEPFFLQVALDGTSTFRLSGVLTLHVDGVDVPTTFDRRIARVDGAAPQGGDGRTWASAFSTVEEAARALPWESTYGPKEIWLRAGEHHVRAVRGVLLGPDCHVSGGFNGTETTASEADPHLHPTVFEGDALGDGSTLAFDDDNPGTFLRFGSIYMAAPAPGCSANGLNFRNAVLQLDPSRAGAIMVFGDAVVANCEFQGNTATPIRHFEGHLRVDRCRIVDNAPLSYPSAIHAYPDSTLSAGLGSSVTVISSEVSSNRAAQFPAIRVAHMESLTVTGCTFHKNLTGTNSVPGAVATYSVPMISITGSIFSGNRQMAPGHGPSRQVYLGDPTGTGTLAFAHNCAVDLDPYWSGNGNIADDPMFLDRAGPNGIVGDADDDVRLAPGSPCIDAGDSTAFGPGDLLDVAGRPRHIDDPATSDTGIGGTRVADIGAHEK